METPDLRKRIDDTEEYGTLVLDFDEYFGQIVIEKPIIIEGQNSTICSESGPVLSIVSEGVELRNLRIEVTRPDSQNSHALSVKDGIRVKLENIIVKGNVAGLVGQDGNWEYPDVLNIWPVIPREKNYFFFEMNIPVSCVLETDIANLKIVNPGLNPGLNRVSLELEHLKEDTILFGHIEIRSLYLTRLISVSGGSFGIPANIAKPSAANPTNLCEKPAEVRPPEKKEVIAPSDETRKLPKPLLIGGIIAAIILIICVAYFSGRNPEKKENSPTKPVEVAQQTPDKTKEPEEAKRREEAEKAKAAEEAKRKEEADKAKAAEEAKQNEAEKAKQKELTINSLMTSGNTALKENKPDEAEKSFAKIFEHDKENKAAKASLALVGKKYAEMGNRAMNDGDCAKAQVCFQSAYRLLPDDAEIGKLLATAKDAKGTLSIYSDPKAEIFIDDASIRKTTPADGVKVSCGKHRIKLEARNDSKYPVRTAEVSVKANQTIKVIVIGNGVQLITE